MSTVKMVQDFLEWNDEHRAIRVYSRFDHCLTEDEFVSAFLNSDEIRSLSEYQILLGFEFSFVSFVNAISGISPVHLIHSTRGSIARTQISFDELFLGFRQYKEKSRVMYFFVPMYELILVLHHDFAVLVFGSECDVLVEYDRAAEKAGLHIIPA